MQNGQVSNILLSSWGGFEMLTIDKQTHFLFKYRGLMAQESLTGLGFDSSSLPETNGPHDRSTHVVIQSQKEKQGFVSGLEAKPIVKKKDD